MFEPKKFIDLIIIPYLRGKEIYKITLQMQIEEATKVKFQYYRLNNKDPLKKSLINSLLKKLFLELNIVDEVQQKEYINENENLYQLLIHLYRDGHHHLGHLIDLIESAQPRHTTPKWVLPAFLIGLLSFVGSLFEYSQHDIFIKVVSYIKNVIAKVITWGKNFMSIAKNAALIGIITNSFNFLYKAKQIFSDDKLNPPEKAYEIAFIFIASILTFAAYLISFASAGTMTIFSGIFLVAASCVEIIKASLSLVASNKNTTSQNAVDSEMTAVEKAQSYRQLYDYKSQRARLILKVCTTVLTSLSVAAWTFFPIGWTLIAGCIGAMILTETISEYVSIKLTNYYSNHLQHKIFNIDGIDNDISFEDESSINVSMSQLKQSKITAAYNPSTKELEILIKLPVHDLRFFKREPSKNASTQTPDTQMISNSH